uniref:A-kinase anchor protein 7-like phosphoesterase domain-containing protein n=1 Tax=Ditylenchus dipsaci TaxID=166011 RepID=A0A915CYJ7_9BILA
MLVEIVVVVSVTALLSFLIFYFIMKLYFTRNNRESDVENQREDLLAIEKSEANISTLIKQKQEIVDQKQWLVSKTLFTQLEVKIDSIAEQQGQHENILNNIQQAIGRLEKKDDEAPCMLNNQVKSREVFTVPDQTETVPQPSTSKEIVVCILFHIKTQTIWDNIAHLRGELIEQNGAYSEKLKSKEKLHVTILKASVKENQKTKVIEAFVKTMAEYHEKYAKYSIMLRGTKCLHNEKNDVLAIELANRSKKRIKQINGIARKYFSPLSCIYVNNNPYDPHLTLVHLKDPTNDELLLVGKWNEFTQKHSTTMFGTEQIKKFKLTANIDGDTLFGKNIQETNSKLAFEGPNYGEYLNGRVLSIKAYTLEDIQNARKRVEEICGSENVQDEGDRPPEQNFYAPRQFSNKENLSDNNNNNNPQSETSLDELVEDEFLIPADLVAHVVGRDEANLKSVKASLSLTSIEMLMVCKLGTGQSFCPISICGTAEKVEKAKIMLQRMLNCFVPKPLARPPVPISPNATFLEEYPAPNQVLHDETKDEVPVQQALSPVQESSSLTPALEIGTPVHSSPMRQAIAPVCNSPVQQISAAAPISPVRESSAPDPVHNISVQESPVSVQMSPKKQVPEKALKTLETPVRKHPILEVPVQKAVSTLVQQHTAVVQQSPVHETITSVPKVTAVSQSIEMPVQTLSPVKKTTIPNRPLSSPEKLERSLKRPLANKGQEDGFKTKMQKKQLKVFEEQQEYFKKRSLLVEKQIEQIEMENYAKKTQLGLPATLCINHNGQTIHLSNEYADENKRQTE